MAPDGTGIFNEEAQMVEVVVYEKDVEEETRWGFWRVVTHPVECGKTGKIIECQKHITVNPEASLSLQVHKGRGETYIGLEGTTHVCVNGDIFELKEGEELYIPRGALHFSWNEGNEKSKFHEIQKGPLCNEGDIKRSADKYKLAHELDSDESVVEMMISVAKDRWDNGERVTYDYGSDNPYIERVANVDLLNIYQECRHDKDKLRSKINEVLQKCKKIHIERTPAPMPVLKEPVAQCKRKV